MISKSRKKPKTLAIMLVLALAVLFTFHMNPVLANVPDVTSIEWYTSGLDTYLNITVEHSSPDSTHYVDNVEVEYKEADAGSIFDDIALGPQSTETFFVEYNLHEVTEYDTYVVRARATCTTHGEASWSAEVTVPEFSTLSLLLILAIASIAVLLLRSNARALDRKCPNRQRKLRLCASIVYTIVNQLHLSRSRQKIRNKSSNLICLIF